MLDWILFGVGGLLFAALALWGVLLVSMRTKFQPVLRGIRRLNRALWNPMQMKTAGSRGATYAIIRHVGRKSGNEYETPVGVVSTPDGFVIALPYGPSADWVRNVVSADSAVIVHEGTTQRVERPEIVGSTRVGDHLTAKDRFVNSLYGVRDFLVLHAIEDSDPDRRLDYQLSPGLG